MSSRVRAASIPKQPIMDLLVLGALLDLANQSNCSIVDSDMPQDMRKSTIQAVKGGFQNNKQLSDVASHIKEELERKHGASFVVYLRENDASATISFSFQKGTLAKVKYSNYLVIIFKPPVASTLIFKV